MFDIFRARLVICFDLLNRQSFIRATLRIQSKYPDVAFGAFDDATKEMLDSAYPDAVFNAWLIHSAPLMCIEKYNVIGILCGSSRDFPELDRRVMRC